MARHGPGGFEERRGMCSTIKETQFCVWRVSDGRARMWALNLSPHLACLRVPPLSRTVDTHSHPYGQVMGTSSLQLCKNLVQPARSSSTLSELMQQKPHTPKQSLCDAPFLGAKPRPRSRDAEALCTTGLRGFGAKKQGRSHEAVWHHSQGFLRTLVVGPSWF